MIEKGIFHTHLVVKDIAKSVRFYTGLFGMHDTGFKDGTLVFLTTPGRDDLLALNPGGSWGYPGGCATENPREEKLAGVQGGAAHFGYMLPNPKITNGPSLRSVNSAGAWWFGVIMVVSSPTPTSPTPTAMSSKFNMADSWASAAIPLSPEHTQPD